MEASRTSRRRSSTRPIRRGVARLPDQPRRHRARPAGEGDDDPGRRLRERRHEVRRRRELRARGAEGRLHEDEGDQARNNGSSPATFNVAQANAAGSPHTVSLSTSSRDGSGRWRRRPSNVTLNVPAATAGSTAPACVPRGRGPDQFTPAAGIEQRRHAARAVLPGAAGPVEGGRRRSAARRSRGTMRRRSTRGDRRPMPAAPGRGRRRLLRVGPRGRQGRRARRRTTSARSASSRSRSARRLSRRRAFLVFAVNTYDRWSNAVGERVRHLRRRRQ